MKIIDKSGLNFHSFRKFYVSNLVRKGVPIPVIASNVGHQDISTTQSYIFLDDAEKMKLTMNALDRPTEIMQLRPQQPDFYQQIAMPQPSLPPINALEKLKLQFINNEVSEEEYIKKLRLLNPEGIKQIVELKAMYD
ncbi:site-specific integrase [Candidatus Woesearchaeota archaeon]|nr:site-specific integrase [Candidatus Woesearchaeota archaeon]